MRRFLALLTNTALSAIAIGLCCASSSESLNEVVSLPGCCWWLWQAPDKDAQVEAQMRDLRRRRASTEAIGEAVLAGRLPLGDAVAEMAKVMRDYHDFWREAGRLHPEWSRERWCASLVIELVADLLRAEGKDPAAATRALWEEFDAMPSLAPPPSSGAAD
jgi:hypothetical protein